MCRLYGFRASHPSKVECTLVHAQNALLIQSQSDRTGRSHADGWGIAYYANHDLQVERRHTAAYEDLHFSATAERVCAHTVVAHVRRATVGTSSSANTHPFRFGHWIFAHNGTISAFAQIESEMGQQTDPKLLHDRKGTTDSELTFLWLLTRLAEAGIDLQASHVPPEVLTEVAAESVKRLASWCDEARAEKPAKLNFLLTDGKVLIASHWNDTLFWVKREGVRDCEICGIRHIELDQVSDYRAAVLASEPISHEDWQEIPDRHVLSVNETLEVKIFSIDD